MPRILTDARLAQRDASRRLYFVAAGCLHHPEASLVLDADPTARIALEQSIEAALQFAELSEEEAHAFRERAVAATRVVQRKDKTYAFEQPEREARRRWHWRDIFRLLASSSPTALMPPKRRREVAQSVAFVRLLGVLACTWLLFRGMRIFGDALSAFLANGGTIAEVWMAATGIAVGGIAALFLIRLIRPLFE